MSGVLITFEGVDFSGKTTQLRLLRECLERGGVPVRVFREPGGTDISEKIRSILLDKSHTALSRETEVLLYEAARAQVVQEVLRPALDVGAVVLCDRFFDSTTAYQGYGRGMDRGFLQELNLFATQGLVPDLTILIDITPESARCRCASGEAMDRLELEKVDFHRKVRAGYLEIALREKDRVVVIDGDQPATSIHDEIVGYVKAKTSVHF